MVAIPITLETKRHCPTHLCLRYDLFQRSIHSLNVVKSPRQRRNIMQQMQVSALSPTSLDEQQEFIFQQEESAFRCAQNHRVIQYRSGFVLLTPNVKQSLRQTEGRSLLTWAIAPEATLPEDIAFCQVMYERNSEPFLTTQGQCKAHRESIDRGISARPI